MINVHDPVEKAINMFKIHFSIIRIKGHTTKRFSFLPISESNIPDLITKLDSSKADDIPPKRK